MQECTEIPAGKVRHPQVRASRGFCVDGELVDLLEHCWSQGHETICSCQGESHVKHGLLGRRHDHQGFIIFADAHGATYCYELLHALRMEALVAGQVGHTSDVEHVVEFPPLLLGQIPAAAIEESARSLACHKPAA